MKTKKITKSITIAPNVDDMLKDLMEYYGQNASAMIAMVISEFHGTKYRIARFGPQKGTEKLEIKKKSLAEEVREFEALSDEDATKYLHKVGYFSPEELEEKEFSIVQNESGRAFRMVYRNGGGTFEDPWGSFMADFKKFLIKKRKDESNANNS